MIVVGKWNLYLKELYESPIVLTHNQTLHTTKIIFTIEDVESSIKHLAKWKAKDTEI